jgi:flagellum-specific ATP synthase
MPQVVNEQQLNLAQRLKQLYSYYQQNRDLISVGAYQPGSDKLLDQAVERLPYIQAYLQQKTSDSQNLQSSQQQLQQLMAPIM